MNQVRNTVRNRNKINIYHKYKWYKLNKKGKYELWLTGMISFLPRAFQCSMTIIWVQKLTQQYTWKHLETKKKLFKRFLIK